MSQSTQHAKNALTTNMAGLKSHVAICLALGQVAYIEGNPGGGKTQGVNQACADLGYHCVERLLSQMLPEDIGGIPTADLESKRAVRLMGDIIADVWQARQEHGKPVAVFFDEFNMAAPLVSAAAFKLVHEGTAGGFQVPEDTCFIVAGNDPSTNALAQDVPAPLINRMSKIIYDGPDIDEWMEHVSSKTGADAVHPIIAGFLNDHSDYLSNKADFNSSMPTPTARSWMEASRTMRYLDKQNISGGKRITVMASHVGPEAANMCEAYVKHFSKLVRVEDIMKDPEKAPLPEQSLVLHYMQAVMLLGHADTFDTTKVAVKYVERLMDETHSIFGLGVIKKPNGPELATALSKDFVAKVAKQARASDGLSLGGDNNTAAAAV